MELEGRRIAVTGATGFLGRYFCAELLARGAHVVGVARNPKRVPELLEQGVEMRRADLTDRGSLEAGFQGVDAVISNAALFDISNRDWEDHNKANIQGGANVVEATAAAGVKRLVAISSCGVYANQGKDHPDEDGEQFSETSKRKALQRYAISKALAEQAAWRLSEEHDLQMTAIRPSGVYGAHDPNVTPAMLKLARKPLSLPYLRLSLVYGGDVSKAVCRTLSDDATIGRAYNTAGPDVSLNVFLGEMRAAYGIKMPFRVPLPIPMRLTFDSSRSAAELGFENRSFREGLADTLRLERG